MAFLEGSKAVSTSIGGSKQTINFTPILNARGATSGGTIGGVSQTDAPTVTTQQNSGGDPSTSVDPTRTGLIPGSFLDSSRPVEARTVGDPNYLSQSGRSFTPGQLDTQPMMAEAVPWLPLVLLAGLAFIVTR